MANKKRKVNITDERIEDTTQYGEFIPSFHQWTSSERQRATARHLEEVSELNEPKVIKRRGYDQTGEQKENKTKK
jgi:hypothetical protein